VNCPFGYDPLDIDRRDGRKAYLEPFFCLAQRFFCASEIRLLASALMWRRLRGCEPLEVTDAAAVLFADLPPSNASIALSMRSLSSFNSPIIRSVSK
jgi:hypothetical protein